MHSWLRAFVVTKPWNGDLIRTTANMIEKARDRARGEHGTNRSRRKLLLDAVELCSKLHPLVAKEVGSERSLIVEASNEFEQDRMITECVRVLERWDSWENRLIKAALSSNVDCYCVPQGLQSQGDSEVFGRFLEKLDEQYDKI